MKLFIYLLLCFKISSVAAQPTGHQKIYLQIIDNGDTIHFENLFGKSNFKRFTEIKYKGYQLADIGESRAGFSKYPNNAFFHKTLYKDDHRLQIISPTNDTMDLEIINAFNVYFLSIAFQKGDFKMYINDDKEFSWNHSSLPVKAMANEQIVYNITPTDWNFFLVNKNKIQQDYFISNLINKQQSNLRPIIPEDDPNFKNGGRLTSLLTEYADYNFNGFKDVRKKKTSDTARWDYFIYNVDSNTHKQDSLLSNLDVAAFDFEKKTFLGYKTTQVSQLLTFMDNYEYVDKKLTLVRHVECVHAFVHSEKIDCSVYALVNGKMQFIKIIKGAE